MARESGSIHYARYAKSERLQRLLAYLLDGQVRTTLDIIRGAGVCAVNSAVCELRRNGFSCYCVSRSKPALYQLTDPVAARAHSARLLGPQGVVNG